MPYAIYQISSCTSSAGFPFVCTSYCEYKPCMRVDTQQRGDRCFAIISTLRFALTTAPHTFYDKHEIIANGGWLSYTAPTRYPVVARGSH